MNSEDKTSPKGTISPLTLSVDELAVLLGVSQRHIHRLNAAEKIPRPIRLGHCLKFLCSDIHAWLKAGAPDRRTWEAMKGKYL